MITFENVTYTYPESAHPILRNVSFVLPAGSLTLVMGPSGVGKSTLLRCLNGLVPHFSGGTLAGRIEVNRLDPVAATPKEMSRHVGFVFQDPEAQFVTDRVEDEIAFALENAGMPRPEMQARVAGVLDLLGLTALRRRQVTTLSGGEQQRVAIATALALRPQVLALDEPTSQLDPQSAEDVLATLARLNAATGLTVVLVEHRLERILPFADRVISLTADAVQVGSPAAVLRDADGVPPVVALGKALGWNPLPLTVEEGLPFSHPLPLRAAARTRAAHDGAPYLTAQGLEVAYAGGQKALHPFRLALYPGEVAALLGPNGAGKTTLLKALVGLIRPQAGKVMIAGRETTGLSVAEICRHVGYLPQDPNALLFADTVLDELHITLRNHGIPLPEAPVDPQALLAHLRLADKAGAYPRDLSVGERQRAALGAILITHPGALLLDEPTRGLDYAAKETLTRLLRGWRDEGMAVLLVTHDVELVAEIADRVLLMQQGTLVADGLPDEVLTAWPAFKPQMARLFPGAGCLTVAEVLQNTAR